MSHSNISIFVPHMGCPHTCSFCNQHTITGEARVPHAEDVKRICAKAMGEVKNVSDTEIAFFGGSFTAIERDYMTELLESAQEFIGEGRFKGIRISTRPDCIDREILDLLKRCRVTAIELGAQSLDDTVLKANERGHTAKAVYDAASLIREYGFELGLQVMVGLYKSDSDSEHKTMEGVLEIHPDTARIYPVCVLEGTALAELYRSGEYKLMDFDDVIGICAEMTRRFEHDGIKILRIGLHASKDVEDDLVAGYYHPALGEIVHSRIVRDFIEENALKDTDEIVVYAGKSAVSIAVGHKKSNKLYFLSKGRKLTVIRDDGLESRECSLSPPFERGKMNSYCF